MSKAVLIFLIFIILLGIFGKLRLPSFPKIKRNSAMSQAKNVRNVVVICLKILIVAAKLKVD